MNIAGHVLTYNSKNFHWLNKWLDIERSKSELGKPVPKKTDQKFKKTENRSKNSECQQKNHLVQTKNSYSQN